MSLANLQNAAGAWREGSCYRLPFLPLFLSFDFPPAPLNIPNVDDLVLLVASHVGRDWRWGRRRWRLSVRTRLALRLSALTLQRRRLGGVGSVFKLKTTLKTSVVPNRFYKSTTLLMAQVAWISPAWNVAKEFQFQSISIIWVPIHCIVWSKYLPRLGMLFYILSRLGSIRWGLASAKAWQVGMLLYIWSRFGSIRRGLACNFVSWHAGLFILFRLGSICRGFSCCSISCHALAVSSTIRRGLASCYISSYYISCHAFAVSAEAWQAMLYLVMPWQYLPRFGNVGMLFYILSRLGRIRWRTNLQIWVQNPKLRKLKSKEQSRTRKPKRRQPELRKLNLNKQRHAGVLTLQVQTRQRHLINFNFRTSVTFSAAWPSGPNSSRQSPPQPGPALATRAPPWIS